MNEEERLKIVEKRKRGMALVLKDGIPCVKIRRPDMPFTLYFDLEEVDHMKGMVEAYRKPPTEVPI